MKSVILTNKEGQSLETCEILKAHTNGGKLHKAFSVVIFNEEKSKILLQKRSSNKLLFPEFWANTCCSHPQENAPLVEEAKTRLMEECGFETDLSVFKSFIYKANDPNGNGTEYEYDTILIGNVSEEIELHPDPDEVMDMKWMQIDELKKDMNTHPETYAPWFHDILSLLYD